MTLSENIALVQANIIAAAKAAGRDPGEITLVAATKVQTAETVRAAIAAGISVCGENRVQEMTEKQAENAYAGSALHFIGHLQTNKVKQVVGQVALIHSVGSAHLLEAIEAQAAQLDLRQDILLEVNLGGEASKSGVTPEALPALAQKAAALPHVRLRGLMTVPPQVLAAGGSRQYFAEMYHLYVDIRRRMGDNVSDIDCLSMGMSGDYEDAVREGATLVRVGTAIFGPRPPILTPKEKAGREHTYELY
ncbi:MAG: YggS family pyridoxal phosphate-dependent enzyme [Pseudoflavonifractor sp.]